MMRLKDVLKRIDSPGKLCISRKRCNKEGEGVENIFDDYYDQMKYCDIEPFLNYKVFNIMAGDGAYGCCGVLYIDIMRPDDKELMIQMV